MTSIKRLFLIDGMAQIYRAHFAMIKNPLLTKDGKHTSAIFGFMNSLFKLIREQKPDYLAIVLDCKEPTFRHKLYTEYKATRESMPDELVEQLEPLYELISQTKIPIIKKPGYEADDIMGTLAKTAEQIGLETYLVTSDKDMMQLVSEKIFMYSPGNSFKPTTIYDKYKVKEKWGVGPEGMIEMLALVGDSSDNVPGIDGIGPKTARKLLDQYKDLDTILENVDMTKNKRVREGLQNGRELVYLSKELVTIDCNVPLEFHFEEFAFQKIDVTNLIESFKTWEIYSLIPKAELLSDKQAESVKKSKKYYKIIQNESDLDNLVLEIQKTELISFDLETTSIKALEADIIGISFSFEENCGYYIPIEFPEKSEDYELNIDLVLKALKPEFESNSNYFCGQNMKYDALVLSRYDINLQNITFDTMVAEYLIHPEKNSYKLDYLSLDYMNYKMVPIEDLIGHGFQQIPMAEVPLDDILYYAAEDADVVFQLTPILIDKLKSENLLLPYNNIELPLIPVLAEIEKNGVYVDTNLLSQLSIEFSKDLNLLTKDIYKLASKDFNINSPKQLAEILFDDIGLKPIKKRSTAVGVLEVLKNYHPLPKLILEYRHFTKLKSTYIDAFPNYINNNTGRIHTSLNQTIASTGRLSSSDPNFQNIPIRTESGRRLRKAFIPQDEKSVILSADYSQIELRIMAHYSKEQELIQAFQNEIDIHTRTAALVNGIDEKNVTTEQRQSAKVVNFGIMYGAGPYRMSNELGITMAEAKILIDQYFHTYPGILRYMNETIEKAKKNGYVETLFNRKRWISNLNASNKNLVRSEERIAINMPIQGTAADLIKIAMINIHKRIKNENYKSKMILQVHDELLFECPEIEVEEFAIMVQHEMEMAIELIVPLKVDWNYGKNWLEAH